MPFKNRIRLPLYIKQPQFPAEANRFRLANGETKTQSVVIRKTYQLVTDYMPERMHQRLIIALNHDEVNIEASRFLGGIAVDGDYKIDWQDFLDYPVAPAEVQIQVTPFAATNDNCQTCEEVSQITLVDDTIEDPIPEGGADTVNAFENDSICCSPITAEIISFNTTYVQSATIDPVTGIVTITAKNPSASVTNALLATYRVTCPNGGYDEANIYGTIEGTEPSCEDPADLLYTNIEAGEDQISWTGTGNFEWQLFTCDNLGTPIQTGTSAGSPETFSDLNPGQCYVFSIRKDCGGGSFSEWVTLEFTIPSPETSCGRFLVTNNAWPDVGFSSFSYMSCSGVIDNRSFARTTVVCMMVTGEIPLYFESTEPDTTYEYTSEC